MIQMNRDKDLFWQLLEPEYKRAMMYCRKIMQNREQGDDLFQNSLVIGLQKFDQLRDTLAFRSWIYQIINSQFKSSIRQSRKRTWLVFTTEIEQSLSQTNQIESPLAKIWLEKILKTLAPEEQTLIVMYELEKWTISEIASLQNKSEGAIKQKLLRIRNKMKKKLSQLTGSDISSFSEIYYELKSYVL